MTRTMSETRAARTRISHGKTADQRTEESCCVGGVMRRASGGGVLDRAGGLADRGGGRIIGQSHCWRRPRNCGLAAEAWRLARFEIPRSARNDRVRARNDARWPYYSPASRDSSFSTSLSSGSAYPSSSQRPRSIVRHRSLQNGSTADSAGWNSRSQVGQRIVAVG